MLKMVRLVTKSGNRSPAEIQAKSLFHLLEQRGMPTGSLDLFSKQLEKGKPIDGATIYAEFANIIFEPFNISWEEARKRQLIIL